MAPFGIIPNTPKEKEPEGPYFALFVVYDWISFSEYAMPFESKSTHFSC